MAIQTPKELIEFDPAKLEAFFDLLVQSGIEEFEGYGMHIRFTTAMFTPDRVVKNAPAPEAVMERDPEPQSIWHESKLWPGGKPPEFPNK